MSAAIRVTEPGQRLSQSREYPTRPWVIAFTVTLATFMEILDTSVANVALPHIAGGLAASVNESTWVLTSYLVSNGIVLPLSAWAAGLLGRKRFYMGCVAVFTLSSFLCGIAPSLGVLILFRVIQGTGGGGLQPSEQAILTDTFPPEKRGMAFAVYGMAILLAPSIGPTLGGYIADHFSWRWIFFINIPVGIVSLVLTNKLIADPAAARGEPAGTARAHRMIQMDYIGLGLVALGFGSLQVVLDRGQEYDWFGSHVIVAFGVIGALALTALLVWEWRCRNPVIDLRLFTRRSFSVAALMIFVLGLVLYGVTVLLPLFTQQLLGYTPELSGFVLSPGGMTLLVMMPVVGWLSSRYQARALIAFGFAATAIALIHLTGLNRTVDLRTLAVDNIYVRVGLAFLFIPINLLAYLEVPPEKTNQVSSMLNLFRNLGGSIGVSLVTTFLDRREQFHQDTISMHVTHFDLAYLYTQSSLAQQLLHAGLSAPDAAHQAVGRIYTAVHAYALTEAYLDTMKILAIICMLILPLSLILKANDPRASQTLTH